MFALELDWFVNNRLFISPYWFINDSFCVIYVQCTHFHIK